MQSFPSDAAERVARLWVDNGYILVVQHFTKLANQHRVVGKLAFADASHIPQKPFPADKSVDCHDIIGPARINNLRGHLEIHERIMVAEQDERRFEAFCADALNFGAMGHHGRPAEEFCNGFQIP